MGAYPDAKVLLSIRDPQRWYDSAQGTIARGPSFSSSPLRSLLFRSAGLLVPSMRRVPSIARKVITERSFGGRFDDRMQAVEAFERHNREVQERVPAEKLLVYEVGEGWQP